MTSNEASSIKYTLLHANHATPTCCCSPCEPRSAYYLGTRVVWYKQLGLAILLVFLLILVAYQSVWHTQAPHDVFHNLLDDSSNATQDEVWDKIRIKHTKRRLPQCLIIGIRKAGTRALLTFLNLHPQIQTAKNEVHFFDDDEAYVHGYDWYRKRMPYSFPGQITLEKSPSYFKTRETPQRIHQMNESMKLLLIVRDPTERAVSDYLQLHIKKLSKGKPSEPFEALAMTPDGEVDESYVVLRLSLYYKHMRNWLKYFPLEQIHIVDGDNLVKNPLDELRDVETFLGIDHRINKDMVYFNSSRGFYCVQNSSEQKCLDHTKGRKHPDVDPIIIHKLRKYFRPYNQRFFQMIGREFDWPTE